MVCECWKAPEDSVSHGLRKPRLGGVSSLIKLKYMCKQKRRGMIYLAGRDAVPHGSRSWKVRLARGLEYPLPFVDNNKHRSKSYFYALYMISKLEKL